MAQAYTTLSNKRTVCFNDNGGFTSQTFGIKPFLNHRCHLRCISCFGPILANATGQSNFVHDYDWKSKNWSSRKRISKTPQGDGLLLWVGKSGIATMFEKVPYLRAQEYNHINVSCKTYPIWGRAHPTPKPTPPISGASHSNEKKMFSSILQQKKNSQQNTMQPPLACSALAVGAAGAASATSCKQG